MVGFSWILIVVTVIVAALALLTALYLLVYYQHPEDKNQVTYCSILPAGILLSRDLSVQYCHTLQALTAAQNLRRRGI